MLEIPRYRFVPIGKEQQWDYDMEPDDNGFYLTVEDYRKVLSWIKDELEQDDAGRDNVYLSVINELKRIEPKPVGKVKPIKKG